jgi:hypothetical protein
LGRNWFFIGRSGQTFQVTNGGGDPAGLSGSGGVGRTSVSGDDRPDVVPGRALIRRIKLNLSGSTRQPLRHSLFARPDRSEGRIGSHLHNRSSQWVSRFLATPVWTSCATSFSMDVDFSMAKSFRISEGKSLQIRAEAFNVFNMQILGIPGADGTSGTRGVIHSISSTPRELQFGAKFVF